MSEYESKNELVQERNALLDKKRILDSINEYILRNPENRKGYRIKVSKFYEKGISPDFLDGLLNLFQEKKLFEIYPDKDLDFVNINSLNIDLFNRNHKSIALEFENVEPEYQKNTSIDIGEQETIKVSDKNEISGKETSNTNNTFNLGDTFNVSGKKNKVANISISETTESVINGIGILTLIALVVDLITLYYYGKEFLLDFFLK
ncbi:hypothetical protein KKB10_01510 [Patescibacteria group bacterium]|nr:hypothetical protein [Patescibacteria group bacterium]MBU1951292.1 hypothetical protein [Patescibacteria group bacterium]MBU2229498.1 hypothetical protein [Patescibacteria group bacterium]MBU2236317.1 hypothetical protein [Patescibacteria group bacterium]